MITNARKEYFNAAGLDVAASAFTQLVTLIAILLAANLSSLGSAAKLTLALSIAGPIYLLASMALTERIVASADGYTSFCEIASSRLLIYMLASVAAIAAIILFWPSKLSTEQFAAILALVLGARLIDCVSDSAIQMHRRARRFRTVFDLAALSLVAFFVSFAACYTVAGMDAALASAWSIFLSAFVVTWQAVRKLPTAERRLPMGLWQKAVSFTTANASLGGAQLVNSLQGNAPRFALEIFVGSQSQAAFTILSSLARVGAITLQSGFIPLLPRYAGLHTREPRRALVISLSSFALATLAVGLGFALFWWLGWRWNLVRLLGGDIQAYISFEAGLGILVGVTLYMLRFAMWQVYGLFGAGDKLLAYAITGLLTTTVGCLLLVPRLGVLGAAVSDAFGSIILVGLPFVFLWIRGKKTNMATEISS